MGRFVGTVEALAMERGHDNAGLDAETQREASNGVEMKELQVAVAELDAALRCADSDEDDDDNNVSGKGSKVCHIRFDSIRFDSIRFDSIRFDSIRFDSIRFGSVRLGSVRFSSLRLG